MLLDANIKDRVKIHKHNGGNKLCESDILKILSWVQEGFPISSISKPTGLHYASIKYHCEKYHIKAKSFEGHKITVFPPVHELKLVISSPCVKSIKRVSHYLQRDADKSQYIWYIQNSKNFSRKEKRAIIKNYKRERNKVQPAIARIVEGIARLPSI